MGIIAETFVRVRPDTSGFRLETQRGVKGALTGIGAGGAAASLGFGVAGAAAFAFGLAAKEAIGGAVDLERELNVFQATSTATAEQMQQVAAEARRLGADLTLPAVSAGDAGRAFTELAKGGLDVQDTLGGARGVLQLAAAGALDVADAAGIAAQALNTFRLPGEEATHVADLLAAAANSATGEVGDFAIGLSQAGAVAAQQNISLDDTVTALALLAKNGLLGSDAGTSLRTTLLRLIPQTKEAAETLDALGISTTDQAGNIRPLAEIFEDYRQKLALLTQEQQTFALTAIFGTDAIRSASIFAREGAAGFDEMRTSVTEEGAASKLAAARTKGLGGELSGLASNAETLATNVGSLAIPALTDFVGGVNDVISVTIDGEQALEDFGRAFADLEVPGTGFGVRDAFGFLREEIEGGLPVVGMVKQIKDLGDAAASLVPQFGEGEDAIDSFVSHAASELGDRSILNFSIPVGFASAEDRAHAAGRDTGTAFESGISSGIESAEHLAVRQARASLAAVVAEGGRAVAEAIRQGDEAVRAATAQAKQNLVSIATELSADAAQIIDQGPLARRIKELQASLSTERTAGERAKLRESLRDAQKELEDAQGAVSTGGRARSAAQQEAVDDFLKPFQRKVRDAKAALAEFNTEGVISELQKEADAQKKIVSEGIADLVIQFNRGSIDLQALSQKTARLLKQNGVTIYGETGRALGAAFKTEFLLELDALRKQAAEVRIGPATTDTGLEPNVVSVSAARAGAAASVQAAQQSANERRVAAQQQLERARTDYLRSISEDSGDQTELLKQIRDRLRPTTSTTKSSGDVRRPVPTGGR